MRPLLPALLLASGSPFAAPFGQNPVQGELSGADGLPLDSSVSMTFTLYGDDQGTQSLWTGTQTVAVDRGAFTAYLGDDGSLDLELLKGRPAVYLGVQVGTNPEMDLVVVGRAPFAAFADHAGDAATLGRRAASDFRLDIDAPDWSEITNIPPDLVGGTYFAGDGITLLSNTFAVDGAWLDAEIRDVCFDDASELHAALDGRYRASGLVDWDDVANVPADLADGDDVWPLGEGLVEDTSSRRRAWA